jgi:DNA gyrase inhibitor GyrI/DNA-binding transcriptional ArsR family regulator
MNESDLERVLRTLETHPKDMALVLGSLAHEKRIQILRLLLVSQQEFSDLQSAISLSKTALVHHLNKLVESGIVNHADRGLYEITPDGRSLITLAAVAYSNTARRAASEARDEDKYVERLRSVQIVELPPMRVASFQVISKTPENDALLKLREWAEPLGLLNDLENHPVFGFNNPDPTPGKAEYGYEFWIRIGPEIAETERVSIKDFEGGLYAVTTCRLKEEMDSAFFKEKGFLPSWKKLVDWVMNSTEYEMEKRPCLERSHDPYATEDALILDLYTPIRERRS